MDRRDITVDRAAVNNWTRYAGGPSTFIGARQALLDAIEGAGEPSATAPEWMTSPKPGVDAWLDLDGVWLTLVEDARRRAGTGTRRWRATNATAPRRGARRQPAGKVPELARWQAGAARAYDGRPWAEVERIVHISLHARERVRERGSGAAWAAVSTAVCGPAPAWANASRKVELCATWDYEGDEYALVLIPHADRDGELVGATAIVRSWAYADWVDARPPLTVPSAVEASYDGDDLAMHLRGGERTFDPEAGVRTDKGFAPARPMAGGRWEVLSWRPSRGA